MSNWRFLGLVALGGCSAISGLDGYVATDGETIPDGGGGTASGTAPTGGTAGAQTTGGAAGMGGVGGSAGMGGMAGMGGTGGVIADTCGNGSVGPGEECDDGAALDGDGCSAQCVVECPSGSKDPVTFHCYVFKDSNNVTWATAHTDCLSMGNGWDLVGISSQAELDFLDNTNVITDDAWTGGNDIALEGSYVWSNGEPWGFTNWASSEPSSGDCLTYEPISGTGNDQWDMRNCGDFDDWVCELTPAGT